MILAQVKFCYRLLDNLKVFSKWTKFSLWNSLLLNHCVYFCTFKITEGESIFIINGLLKVTIFTFTATRIFIYFLNFIWW